MKDLNLFRTTETTDTTHKIIYLGTGAAILDKSEQLRSAGARHEIMTSPPMLWRLTVTMSAGKL